MCILFVHRNLSNFFLFFQILERDGTDIVPPEFQRYVDAEAVRFIETICKFTVFEGIHRRVVSVA